VPKVPRDLTQDEAVRAFLKADGIELKGRGKGSHRYIAMPNGETLTIPYHVKPGLVSSCIKQAGLTLEEYLELL
jgi:predicted RNA binding protein YcfA (HicA-like mRNA interferase family)